METFKYGCMLGFTTALLFLAMHPVNGAPGGGDAASIIDSVKEDMVNKEIQDALAALVEGVADGEVDNEDMFCYYQDWAKRDKKAKELDTCGNCRY